MLRKLRSRLTYANVMATIAVFLAMGGTSYALIVTGATVQDESLTDADILNGSLNPAIGANSINAAKLSSGAVVGGGGGDVQDNSITGADVDEEALGKVPDADTLDGLDSTAFARRLCPSGTLFHEGACIETTSRAEALWFAAANDCADEHRGLPDPRDLVTFRGRILLTGSEWTGELTFDGDPLAVTIDNSGGVGFAPTFQRRRYRCVATPVGG